MTPQHDYALLQSIVQGDLYQGIPLAFALRKFMNWDDATIKLFLKERKKSLKAQEKRNAAYGDKCCGGGCCGGDA